MKVEVLQVPPGGEALETACIKVVAAAKLTGAFGQGDSVCKDTLSRSKENGKNPC